MSRWVGYALMAFCAVICFGMLFTWISRGRALQDRANAQNSLRELALFGQVFETTDRGKQRKPDSRTVNGILPGTIANDALTPDRRLSWVVLELEWFNQKRQNTGALRAAIRTDLAWDAEPNQPPGRTVLRNLICGASVPNVPVEEPAVTQFVGLAGLGTNGATLPATDRRAGAFRYDGATPFDAFTDGISNTILFGETNANLGAWIRGGPSTVRGLDDSAGAKAFIGIGGQFGGIHAHGANFAFADGSLKFLTEMTNPSVLKAFCTLAGGTGEFVGE